MRVGRGSPPSRQKATRIARPSDGSNVEIHSAENLEGDNPTRILYFNPNPVCGKCTKIIKQQGHDSVIAHSVGDALAMMRSQIFDALVMECAQYSVDILNFTAKAQGLQPSLAVFLAEEWGDELAIGLEELDHVLTMVVDDEFARLAAESRTV